MKKTEPKEDVQFKRLEFLLSGLVGAVNRLGDRVAEGHKDNSKWLAVIAGAIVGDPEVQQKIDQLASEIQMVSDDLEKAVQPKTKE